MFSGGGFVGAWLPFGEVVLGLFVGLLVQCEGSYSSLDVVSVLVYGVAAPVVFGYPECGPSSGGVAVFLREAILKKQKTSLNKGIAQIG